MRQDVDGRSLLMAHPELRLELRFVPERRSHKTEDPPVKAHWSAHVYEMRGQQRELLAMAHADHEVEAMELAIYQAAGRVGRRHDHEWEDLPPHTMRRCKGCGLERDFP